MIPTMPFGRTGHHEHPHDLRSRRLLGRVSTDRRRPHARSAATARRQPHRHRRQLRRRGTAYRAVDGAASLDVLPGHQDRRAPPCEGARRDPTLARPAAGRQLRPDPAAQPGGPADEWDQALGPGGALEAAVEAREQGLVRFIGVTGHGVTVARQHARALERFPFDSVLLPYSYIMMQNPDYAADVDRAARGLRPAHRGGADHQKHHPGAVGRSRT